MASVAAGFFSSWTAPSKLESEWSNDLAEAQHLLRDIAIDFDDRDARFRRGADGARLTAGLRRRVDQKRGERYRTTRASRHARMRRQDTRCARQHSAYVVLLALGTRCLLGLLRWKTGGRGFCALRADMPTFYNSAFFARTPLSFRSPLLRLRRTGR